MKKRKPAQNKASFKEQINALARISSAISSDLILDDILKLIVAVTAQAMRSNICSILLLDEKKSELVISATQSVSESYNKKPALKVGEGIAGRVVKENKPAVIYDVTKEKEYKFQDIAKKEGLCSLLCVPLHVKGKVIGVINSYTSSPRKFSKTDTDILNSIASLAALAIENTDLLLRSQNIEEELKTRKLLERAKGILMRDEGLTEEEAYLKLQKFSMDSRKSMKDIAESLIMSYNLRRLR